MAAERDGFVVRKISDGSEVKFIINQRDGERREDAFELWLGQINTASHFLTDTRTEDHDE